MKILMVCLGNICRSPLAEGILKAKIKEKRLNWKVDSAGTGSWHIGDLPDPRSVAMARKNGINITDQRARQFRAADLDEFDLILAMDKQNYRDVLRFAKTDAQRAKVKMMMDFVQPGSQMSVPDPYWDDEGFDKVYQMLEEACEALVDHYVAVAA
jgi:protein-tyrosine phosphatase